MSDILLIGYCEVCDEQVCVPLENIKIKKDTKGRGLWICPRCHKPWPIEPKEEVTEDA